MKRLQINLLTLFTVFCVFASGAIGAKISVVDLSLGGDEWKGMKIDAPVGAMAIFTSYSIMVNKGDLFQIELHTGNADLASIKNEIRANKVNKLKNITVDKPDLLLYSSNAGMGEEWHFIVNVKTAGSKYYCEDVKGTAYNKADAEVMIMAAQSLRKE
jgi:hypothetical protein